MNEEQQRIAIAEACGWKPEVRKMYAGEKNVKGWGKNAHLHPGDKDRVFAMSSHEFPDYLNDLNAMHQAEKTLTFEQKRDYCEWLCITGPWPSLATARNRAEAFLRTLGMWTESQSDQPSSLVRWRDRIRPFLE